MAGVAVRRVDEQRKWQTVRARRAGAGGYLRGFFGTVFRFDGDDLASDPFSDWRGDGITNESPSTAVQPSGNPISFSHSSQVKFLATDNRPIAVASLMSASLGANRGANALRFGIPKAAAALDQKWIVSFRDFSKTGSSLRFARRSRRRIPVALAAVSKDSYGGVRSITCDNEHALSMVGDAEVERVTREPPAQIPNFFKLVDNCFKRGPLFGTEEPHDVFQDNPSRPTLASKPCKFVEEPAAAPIESSAIGVSVAEVLARPASRPEVG